MKLREKTMKGKKTKNTNSNNNNNGNNIIYHHY